MEATDNKSQVRSWLYELLAELERCDDVEGERTESPLRHITLEIKLKG